MCGVAGYSGPQGPGSDAVRLCLQRMQRRGPDASGTFESHGHGREVRLLHSRLAIIDLDPRSNQPFHYGDLTVVFNGEIYNYLEVRAELQKLGQRFVTDSDTEVLCAALAQWGVDGLAKLEGMWAFAAHDARDGSLLLCRDRFGEKPLYLHRDASGGLYFGSEVKFLAALAGRGFSINQRQLKRFLVYGYKSLYQTGETFFDGIEELPTGTWLRMGPDGETSGRYWTPTFAPENDMTLDEAVAATRTELLRAVEMRLRADVPLAFCMSGGVDSNSLISIAKRIFDYDVRCFTIVNTDERYAEQRFIDATVRELGLDHTPIALRKDGFLQGMRELTRYHDAPLFTITWYVHWLLIKSVAEHGFKIVLTGSGADELFSGYYDHHLFYLHAVSQQPELYGPALDNWRTHILPVLRNPLFRDVDGFLANPGQRGYLWAAGADNAKLLTRPYAEDFPEHAFCADHLRNRMLNELFRESVPVILHEDDLNAMYYSLENRSPFLDTGLCEHTLRIPSKHLVRDGCAKAVLRESMRGIVPDAVLDNRTKTGFNAPLPDLLDPADPATRAELLADSPIFDVVRKGAIKDILNTPDGRGAEHPFLFNFISAKFFAEECAS